MKSRMIDSGSPSYEGWKALDGNPETFWHTAWGGRDPVHPHEITLDLGSARQIAGFRCVPPAGAARAG